MLPFCGYHMGDYLAHWLRMGERDGAKLPKLFNVNWFRKDPETGEFLWPGFGDNARVLAWVFRRCDGEAEARETAVGLLPTAESLDLGGLDLSRERLEAVLDVHPHEGRSGGPPLREVFDDLGDPLPPDPPAAGPGLGGAP